MGRAAVTVASTAVPATAVASTAVAATGVATAAVATSVVASAADTSPARRGVTLPGAAITGLAITGALVAGPAVTGTAVLAAGIFTTAVGGARVGTAGVPGRVTVAGRCRLQRGARLRRTGPPGTQRWPHLAGWHRARRGHVRQRRSRAPRRQRRLRLRGAAFLGLTAAQPSFAATPAGGRVIVLAPAGSSRTRRGRRGGRRGRLVPRVRSPGPPARWGLSSWSQNPPLAGGQVRAGGRSAGGRRRPARNRPPPRDPSRLPPRRPWPGRLRGTHRGLRFRAVGSGRGRASRAGLRPAR